MICSYLLVLHLRLAIAVYLCLIFFNYSYRVSGVEFFWLPFPSLIKYQFRSLLVIQYVIPSGIDVGGFRGSLNAATGTHEFGLGSVKEIIEAPVESSSTGAS